MVPHSAHVQLFPGDLQRDTDHGDDVVTHDSELKPLLIVPQRINRRGKKTKSDGRQMKPLTSQEIRLSVTLLAYSAAPLLSIRSVL